MAAIGIITWIVLGIVTGFIASKVVNLRGDDPLIGIGCAVGGAIVGGILFSVISGRGVLPWDLSSMVCAVAGAVLGAIIYHTIRARSITKTQQSLRRSY